MTLGRECEMLQHATVPSRLTPHMRTPSALTWVKVGRGLGLTTDASSSYTSMGSVGPHGWRLGLAVVVVAQHHGGMLQLGRRRRRLLETVELPKDPVDGI